MKITMQYLVNVDLTDKGASINEVTHLRGRGLVICKIVLQERVGKWRNVTSYHKVQL